MNNPSESKYPPRPADTRTVTNEGIQTAILIGDRKEQQDAGTVDSNIDKNFAQLTFAKKTTVLRQTIEALNNKIKANLAEQDSSHYRDNGTTLCAVFTWIEHNTLHIVVANVGDSRAYVAWVNTDGSSTKKQPETQRLNDLHDLEHEKNRIPQKNIRQDESGTKRLKGRLNMGRSLGNEDLEKYGLSPQPDIYHHQFSLVNCGDSQPIIIVASDGIASLDIAAISNTILSPKKADDISKKLAKAAQSAWRSSGSSDNIFVITIPVVDTTIQSAVVCDGHGQFGGASAGYITQRFYPTLKEKLKPYTELTIPASSEPNAPINKQAMISKPEKILTEPIQLTQLLIITIMITILKQIANYLNLTPRSKLEPCPISTIPASSEPIASVENQTEISELKKIFTQQLKNESLKTIVPKMQKISTESLSSDPIIHWSKHTYEKHDSAISESSTKILHKNQQALDATKEAIYLELLKVMPIITEIQCKIDRLRADIINNKDLKGGLFKRCFHNRAKTTLNAALTGLEGLFTYEHIQNDKFEDKIKQDLADALGAYENTLIKLNSKRNLQALNKIKSTFESQQFKQEVNTSREETFIKIKSDMYPQKPSSLTTNPSAMYKSKDPTEANGPSIGLTLSE